MKKSRLKRAVKDAVNIYYKTGMTNTANQVYKLTIGSIDRAYKEKHK